MEGWHALPEFVFSLAEAEPFSVLLHTARCSEENHRSLLFRRPVRVLEAHRMEEISAVFAWMEQSLADGLHVAGYFAYECGAYFEPRLRDCQSPTLSNGGLPLIWLGCYAEPMIFDHGAGRFTSGDPGRVAAELGESQADSEDEENRGMSAPQMAIGEQEYEQAIAAILEKIRAGETYQANFTTSIHFALERTRGAALRLYRRLIRRQPVGYGAYLNLGEQQMGERRIISLSPEMFFRWRGERLVTRPMKGTMARGMDCAEDEAQAERLRADEKNRAEHLMIVDLLRNDLGRIAEMGSVRVEDLFAVERYATLLQMTSTIAARIAPSVGLEAIFRALFPSGSITGAPKVRTMQILAALEREQRGVYCGAIGYAAPHREAVFSVAIRTLEVMRGEARMGVGGGIVADSRVDEEWRECRLKSSFLSEAEFALIETMLWRDGIALLEWHMKRLADSARYFDFAFDEAAIRAAIYAAARGCEAGRRYRLRLRLGRDGRCDVEANPAAAVAQNGRVAMASERVSSTDRFLRHKTTHRALYERWRARAAAAGVEDFLFLNERGELTEGAISNVFVEREGWLLTPPVSAGALPGVFRRLVLEGALENAPRAREQRLTAADLESADAIWLCNALRGLYRVEMVVAASAMAQVR